jgi:tetratricopeptide (TPR) repeat protein
MKSEHRHELQTNELAEFISQFPEFLKKNARTILAVVLIIVGAISWPILNKKKAVSLVKEQIETTNLIVQMERAKAESRDAGPTDFTGAFIVSASALEKVAGQAKNEATKALALIKRGQAFRMDLHYKGEEVEKEVVASHIKQARAAYKKAITAAKDNNTLTAMANFGLGLCAEELGQYDKAAEIYEKIAANADFAGTVYPPRAEHRLAIMGDHTDKFIFAKAPEPANTIDADFPELLFDMSKPAPTATPAPPDSTPAGDNANDAENTESQTTPEPKPAEVE